MSRSPLPESVMLGNAAYYEVKRATEIIKVASLSTLRRWAKKGWTSFGYPIDTVRSKGRLLISPGESPYPARASK